jgi:hypothetical protein
MLDRRKAEKPLHTNRSSGAKIRTCLICRKEFPSAWAGERICRPCKGTSAWRSGIA